MNREISTKHADVLKEIAHYIREFNENLIALPNGIPGQRNIYRKHINSGVRFEPIGEMHETDDGEVYVKIIEDPDKIFTDDVICEMGKYMSKQGIKIYIQKPLL